MQNSISLIDKQSSEKEELQKPYSELVTVLYQSKASPEQLRKRCTELGQNLENLIKTKDNEIEDLILGEVGDYSEVR